MPLSGAGHCKLPHQPILRTQMHARTRQSATARPALPITRTDCQPFLRYLTPYFLIGVQGNRPSLMIVLRCCNDSCNFGRGVTGPSFAEWRWGRCTVVSMMEALGDSSRGLSSTIVQNQSRPRDVLHCHVYALVWWTPRLDYCRCESVPY